MGIGMMGTVHRKTGLIRWTFRNYESADSSLPTVRLLGTKVD